MRVLISAGGTGGHLYPGIAIADACLKKDSTNQILFVGSKGRMEMSKVPAAGYSIVALPIRGIKRKFKHLLQNLTLPIFLLISLWKSRVILKKFKPHVVIGTGGYAGFAVVYMASYMRIPILLQEQNAYPSMTNKLLARYADKICVAYEGMETYFPANKIILTGNPIRESLASTPERKLMSYAYFDLDPNLTTLLVVGGSLGAKAICEYIFKSNQVFLKSNIQVILSTGESYFSDIQKEFSKISNPLFKLWPYINRMDLALTAATIVVSRAGAITISEIAAAKKPAIFIPSPNVVANHQLKNVLPLVKRKAAILVEEHEVPAKLLPTILELSNNNLEQQILAENLATYFKNTAATDIVDIIEDLVQNPKNTKK